MNGNSIVSDTNPLIYLLDGKKKAADYLDGKQVWISVISELELFGKKGLTENEKNENNIEKHNSNENETICIYLFCNNFKS